MAVVAGSLMIFEVLVELTHHIFCKNFLPKKMHFLQKCYQNLVRNVRHCNKFAKFAILVQTCKILARNAKLTRISEEFSKICDSCNLGTSIAKLVNAILVRQLLVTESICEWCKVLLEKMCWFEANQSRIFVSFLFDLTFVM